MIFSPYLRLLLLALAAYFVVHVLVSCVVWLVAGRAIRWATLVSADRAARCIFGLRLLPSIAAGGAILAFALPGYLWWEPEGLAERMGTMCLILAALGALLWMDAIRRTTAGLWNTARFLANWKRVARLTCVGRSGERVLVAESRAPVIALVGIVRPQIVVSSALLNELSPEQLDTAIEHERAHRASCENLKRLALLAAPDVMPMTRYLRRLDAAWSRFAEWSADDTAAQGAQERSLSLASAMVRVARMGAAPRLSPLTAALVSHGQDLSERVARLTQNGPAPLAQPRSRWVRVAVMAGLAALAAVALQPETFSAAHRLLEFFSHQ